MDQLTVGSRHLAGAGRPWAGYVVAVVLAVVGLGIGVPGATLIGLGGSPYYLLAGAALVVVAALALRRRPLAAWGYAAFLAATILWSLAEAGWNGWALLPRLAVFAVIGLLFLLPGFRRAAPAAAGTLAALMLVAVLLIAGGIARSGDVDRAAGPAIASATNVVQAADRDWLSYGHDQGGGHFSSLAQIAPANVAKLELAWTYRLNGGDATKPLDNIEATPLKVGDTLYLCSAVNEIVAVDAETGQQRWRFDPHNDLRQLPHRACRGVAYYRAPSIAAGQPCAGRILTATVDARLIAVDALTGRLCDDFGTAGVVSLLTGMGEVMKGYYFVTSPPQIVRGKAVVGGWVADGQKTQEPSGVIRAFDAVTGKFAWAWDMGRPDFHGEPRPGEQYTRGTPNSWAPMSADETLGLVYVPTGNATPDYFGGHRSGPAAGAPYSSAVVALDAETGALRWAFQTTHHDIWDYDVGSQPTLFDLPVGGTLVPALAQATKRGELFILDRRTGTSLTGVTERTVPASTVPGEHAAPTQPFSTGFPSFPGAVPTEQRMWGITPFDQLWCRIKYREARFDGTMTPLSVDRPTIVYPGYLGGVDWGGVAVDPVHKLMLVASSNVPMYDTLLTRSEADRLGLVPFGMKSKSVAVGGAVPQSGTPYAARVLPFLSPLQVPCVQPPFSTVAAVDLVSRRVQWQQAFGTTRASGPLGVATGIPLPMGTPTLGGAVSTGSGLTFIGANADDYFRAFDTVTGRTLWKYLLPAGGQATPMTYWSDATGRQFVVIAASGHHGLATKPGDYLLAFALPRTTAR